MIFSTRALQTLPSLLLFAMVMEKPVVVLGTGDGGWQSKLIVSIGLKRKLFSLLQSKCKPFFKYIKNKFLAAFTCVCMCPNIRLITSYSEVVTEALLRSSGDYVSLFSLYSLGKYTRKLGPI